MKYIIQSNERQRTRDAAFYVATHGFSTDIYTREVSRAKKYDSSEAATTKANEIFTGPEAFTIIPVSS